MGKVTRITLVTINGGAEREFDLDHAERILSMRKSGWEIPKNSEYKYENGSISRRDKKKDK